MEYLLYKLAEIPQRASPPSIPGETVEFSPFAPSRAMSLMRAGGFDALKSILMSAWSAAAGAGRPSQFRVFAYIDADERIQHYSIVSPTTLHLPWLDPNERGAEVGGCLTVPSARGKGIYPFVLQQIAERSEISLPLYMIVEESNLASRSGMRRVGFELISHLARKRGGLRPPHYEALKTTLASHLH